MAITKNNLILGDCLKVMPRLKPQSIDMILCDLPYGTTANKWDSVIPLEILWFHYKRLIKPNGVIVLTAQTPFDKVLGCSNLEWLKYEWIWNKNRGTGHLNAKISPMKAHENILIFYNGKSIYNPQMREGKPYIALKGHHGTNYGKDSYENVKTVNCFRYPLSILEFNRDNDKIHPTQKPVKLFEYLIKTYTIKGGLILDNCIGSGTTAIAAMNTNRKWIGIEKEPEYFNLALNRIRNHKP